MRVNIKTLVKEPFGPFWDADILSDECKSTKSKVLPLYDVRLAWNNRPTGLTECEFGQPECIVNKRHPVLVRGVLKIQKLSWLSEMGQRALLHALRKRDEDLRGTSTKSLLILADVYRQKRELKVRIQAKKYLPAVHMKSEAVPDGLFLKCDDRGRFYEVVSMEQETYRRSQIYLARFRLHRELRDILHAYEQKNGNRPLIKDRTPEWFLTEYLLGRPELFPEHGSDSDLQNPAAYDSPAVRAQRIRETANAVRKFFFIHSKWLEQDVRKQRRDPVIDPDVWKIWRIKRYRADASPPPLPQPRAGPEAEDLMDVDDDQPNSDDAMDVDDGPYHEPNRSKRRPSTSIERHPNKRSRHYSTTRSPPLPPQEVDDADSDVSSYVSDEDFQGDVFIKQQSPFEVMDFEDEDPVYQNGVETDKDSSFDEYDEESDQIGPSNENEYDSDFSTGSVLISDDPDDGTPPTPPDVLAAIPQAIRRKVVLPRSGDVWRCPARTADTQWCPFTIDLYRYQMEPRHMMSRENPLDGGCIQRLRALGWRWSDPWVQTCFGKIVGAHYEWHVDVLGIMWIPTEHRLWFKFVWKHPRSSNHARVILQARRALKAEDRQSIGANGDVRIKDEPEASSSREAPW